MWRENASELTGRIKSTNVSADSDARTSGSGDSLSNLSTPVYSCQYPGRNGRPDTCIIRQMFRPYQNHILLQLIPTPKRARTLSLATVILRSMHTPNRWWFHLYQQFSTSCWLMIQVVLHKYRTNIYLLRLFQNNSQNTTYLYLIYCFVYGLHFTPQHVVHNTSHLYMLLPLN